MVSIRVAVALSAALLICFEVANGQSDPKEFNNEDFDTEGPSPMLPFIFINALSEQLCFRVKF